MKHLIALSTLLFALHASAECPSDIPADMPAVPSGTAATGEAMRDARVATLAYVKTVEAYLRCRNLLLPDIAYNQLVERATTAADAYNRELRSYRQRTEALAKN
jgi:hypothetical protein